MKLAFFAVPSLAPGEAAADLNRFLGGHRVVAVDRHLVSFGSEAYWAVCVTYLDGKGEAPPGKGGKVDYREVLSEADFQLFARLRGLRKEIAEREGVPAYALFTNEQLAAMVTRGVRTSSELAAIQGVGVVRVEKYAEGFLALLREAELPPPDPGTNRVIRGGSWNENARNVRAAYRNHNDPSNRWNNLGFRLARAQTRAGGLAPDQAGVRSVPSGSPRVEGGEQFSGRRCADRAVDAAARARRRPASSFSGSGR